MNKVERALRKTTDTKALLLGKGVVAETASMFSDLFPGKEAIIVADKNTWKAAGLAVKASLDAADIPQHEPFIFEEEDLFAEESYLNKLRWGLARTEAIAIAVGSGVINDLVKYASHTLGRRYMCVGTAVSMGRFSRQCV